MEVPQATPCFFPIAGYAGRVIDDGELLSRQSIEQSGFSDIWSANNGNSKGHNLQDFLDPKNYKTYDELKAKLNRVLGVDAGVVETDPFEATTPTAEAPSMAEADTSFPPADNNNESEDDTLSYFAKLAKEN